MCLQNLLEMDLFPGTGLGGPHGGVVSFSEGEFLRQPTVGSMRLFFNLPLFKSLSNKKNPQLEGEPAQNNMRFFFITSLFVSMLCAPLFWQGA
jgi:hypothetical protein